MSFIFVGGCQRTGTSLLQALLCSDPDANPLVAECEYLRQLIQIYGAGKRAFDYSLLHYFDDQAAFRDFNAGWIRRFLEQTLDRHRPARHLVLKEPHLTRHFPDLWELVPEARFVVLVRDPRDTLVSMMDVGERLEARGSGHFLVNADLERLIPHFASFYAPCLNFPEPRFQQQTRYIRYEDLVTAPATVLDSLRQFTGLALEEADPSAPWKRSVRPAESPHPRQVPWRTGLSGKGVSADSIGRYRSRLKPPEIQAIDRAFTGFYSRFGYASGARP